MMKPNRAQVFRKNWECEALKQCTIEFNEIYGYTINLQSILTMVNTDTDGWATAMRSYVVNGSNLYVPFYYERRRVILQ